METLDKLDARYFVNNAREILEDIFPYKSTGYNLSDDILSEVNRFYPNHEDITQADLGRIAHSLHQNYFEDLLIDEVDQIIEQLWNSIQ